MARSISLPQKLYLEYLYTILRLHIKLLCDTPEKILRRMALYAGWQSGAVMWLI